MNHSAERLLSGAVAGAAATLPMDLVMGALHRLFPSERGVPLPPRQIAAGAAEAAGVRGRFPEPARRAGTEAAHLGYGAAAGAAYALLAPALPGPPAARGAGYGLAVWAAGYLGWLPAAGLQPPPASERAARHVTMIAAHVAWGAALGLLTDGLTRRRAEGARDGLPPGADRSYLSSQL